MEQSHDRVRTVVMIFPPSGRLDETRSGGFGQRCVSGHGDAVIDIVGDGIPTMGVCDS